MADVSVRDLVVEYASGGYVVRPINGLDVRADDGELVLLLGASGCGKTTLLSALAGILQPAAGTITVDGTSVTELSGAALTEYRRHQVGIVFQAFNLISSLTAAENVALPLLATGAGRRTSLQRARLLLDQVDLADRVDHRPGDLSGGQQQRVAIARALALEPPLLLADEPTAHLDYIQVEGVIRLLRGLAREGRTIIVATHDDRLLPLADQVVELSPRVRDGAESRVVTMNDGETLFGQGDDGDLVYVVQQGVIELTRERENAAPEVVSRVVAGQYFGELAPMFGLRRSATARAIGPTTVRGCSPTEFRASMGRHAVNDLIGAHAPAE
jgi:putative ABC transport system ATP-binding protein